MFERHVCYALRSNVPLGYGFQRLEAGKLS